MSFLNPARNETETHAAYRERRAASHDYVASILGGSVFWHTSQQGNYTSDKPYKKLGKSGRRLLKQRRRIERESRLAADKTLADNMAADAAHDAEAIQVQA